MDQSTATRLSRRALVGGIGVGALLATVGSASSAAAERLARGGGGQGALSADEELALGKAILDEYRAHAAYAGVIETLGAVLPFANIVSSEEMHISALLNLFSRYGVPVPTDPYGGRIPFSGTRQQACAMGVEAEILNAAMYDDLLKVVKHSDIVNVFTSLRDASRLKHQPAFERCAG